VGRIGSCGREQKINAKKFSQTYSDEVISSLRRGDAAKQDVAGIPKSEFAASSHQTQLCDLLDSWGHP
jgi:hypothetical protein